MKQMAEDTKAIENNMKVFSNTIQNMINQANSSNLTSE
jgi:hypothetical protein